MKITTRRPIVGTRPLAGGILVALIAALAVALIGADLGDAATEKTRQAASAPATPTKPASRPAASDALPVAAPTAPTTPTEKPEAAAVAREATSAGPTAMDYIRHVERLKQRVPEDFTIVVQRPFVVIGDESAETVRRRARGTVKWAVERLKAAYFEKDPPEIIDIWLFGTRESYEKYAKQFFGEKPNTPFGYYSSTDRAMVMNIATGGGTLVHEIVHPFVAANFPDCPAWFNEGLGSLYEQIASREGRIVGLTNWRLAGLQRSIRDGELPSFRKLCSTTTHQFYEMDAGTNYAQARYLCYWLQEHGLLRKFYRAFHADVADDPTGYETLQRVIGRDDMDAFQQEWEKYVLGLRFP